MREHAQRFLCGIRAYEVLPDQTSDIVTVVAFKALRRGWDRTRESEAAKRAARKKGRKWPVTDVTHNGHAAVQVSVPKDKIDNMRQSLNSQGFTEGETPV